MATQLISSLEPRARMIADILASRIPDPGPWAGYQRSEPLVGVLQRVGEVKWMRHGQPSSSMTFGFLKVRGISAQAVGRDEVISTDVLERHEDTFDLQKPVHYTEVLRHSFSRTMNVEEATEQAWKVSAKASFSAKYAGIGGSVEAAAEYGQKLSRRVGESVSVSDEITKTIDLQGPVSVRWIAERSTDTLLRKWEAVPDLDFKLYWVGGNSAWEWSSFADVFVPAARGEAPVDQSYSIFASSSDSHDLFERYPVPDADIALLQAPLATPIPFTAEYQVINRQSISAR